MSQNQGHGGFRSSLDADLKYRKIHDRLPVSTCLFLDRAKQLTGRPHPDPTFTSAQAGAIGRQLVSICQFRYHLPLEQGM